MKKGKDGFTRAITFICLVTAITYVIYQQDLIGLLKPSPGRIEKVMVPADIAGGPPREAYVYLPKGYGILGRRYPVVYALHGWPGSPRDFFSKGRISETAEILMNGKTIRPMIIVAPNGHGPGLLGYSGWADSITGKSRLGTFVSKDLIHYIDTEYGTIASPQGRAIMGVSEGGYGAVNIAFQHPGVFGAVIAHSGHFFAGTARMTAAVFGTGARGRSYRARNSPLSYVKTWKTSPLRLKDIRLFLDSTANDEDYGNSKGFSEQLERLGINHTFQTVQGGHSWRLWKQRFPASLKWLDRGIK